MSEPTTDAVKLDTLGTPEGEAAAVWVDIDTITPWAKNPRLNDQAVVAVAGSIEGLGWGAPIVARTANREIIAGHTRYKAAQQLGLKLVPVRFVDVTEDQAQRLALADNKLGEKASWDDGMLAELLTDLEQVEADIDLEGLGFSEAELAELLDTALDFGDEEEGDPGEVQARWSLKAHIEGCSTCRAALTARGCATLKSKLGVG